MNRQITIGEILSRAKAEGLGLEVEVLLCDYLSVDKAKLFLMHGETLSEEVHTRISEDLGRLQEGFPLAYIRGVKEFYGLEFEVNEHVLIPRPDTEILVEHAIDCIQKLNKDKVGVLELGTGSGCVAISISKNVPNVSVLAVDVSDQALVIASQNVGNHQLEGKVQLNKSDLLQNVEGTFDVVVANLPYIAEDAEVNSDVVEYQPNLALFAGEGGLALYRKTLEQIIEKGMDPECVLFEIGYDQGEEARRLCKRLMPQYQVQIIQDLEGRDRVVCMSK